MNTEYFDLDNPVEQVIRHIIVKFSINDITINLFKSANVYVNMYNSNNECVASKVFLMDGYAYEMWGDNDDYLINWTKEQINK